MRGAARGVVVLIALACLVTSGFGWALYREVATGLTTSSALDGLRAPAAAAQVTAPAIVAGLTGTAAAPTTAVAPSLPGDINILLIGLDSRRDMNGNPLPESVIDNELHAGGGGGLGGYNTNTLILVHVPADGARATAISIPRDDYVSVPGYGMRKIKEAYGLAKADADAKLAKQGVPEPEREREARDAGRRLTLETVEDLLRVPIDHFAEVNLIGFYDVVSAIGPIQVCLNHPVKDHYSGADFPAGLQTLDATQALEFVRQRHGLPNGDLDRTHRQQAFIDAVIYKLRTGGIFTDLGRLQGLIGAAEKDVVIDDTLDPLTLATEASNLTSGNITFYTLPIQGFATRNGQDVNLVDPARLQTEVHALFYPPARASAGTSAPTASSTAATASTTSSATDLTTLLTEAAATGSPVAPTVGAQGAPIHDQSGIPCVN